MIKQISRFSTLIKYYPTKFISPKDWVNENYIPVYKQRNLTEAELNRNYYLQIARLTPFSAYSCYWIFLGPMNTLHVAGFISLFLLYVKQRHTFLIQESKKPISIFMNKNGLDYVAVYTLNAAEPKDNEEFKDLREIFQLDSKEGITKFNVNDIKIVRSGVQPKSEYEFLNLFVDPESEGDLEKRSHNIFEIETNKKTLLIKFQQNEYAGMNEYLSAMLSKKQIVIK